LSQKPGRRFAPGGVFVSEELCFARFVFGSLFGWDVTKIKKKSNDVWSHLLF